MRKGSYKSAQGFTLIEVLVALAVFSSVISLVLYGLEQGRLSWARGNHQVEELRSLVNRQNWLTQMFTQAVPSTFSAGYGTEVPYLQGDSTSLSFITNAPVISGPGTYAFVILRFEQQPNATQSLVFYQWINRDPYYGIPTSFTTGERLVLLTDLSEARWDYYLSPRIEASSNEIGLGNFQPRHSGQWSNGYDAFDELKLPEKLHLTFTQNGHHYVWGFNMPQRTNAAGITQSMGYN